MRSTRIPQVGDKVGALGQNGAFVVSVVNKDPNTVMIRLLSSKDFSTTVPWGVLTYLDEEDVSQAAARVVGEATEKKN